uniref:Uncharacterized protein n=1 Tax=Amphimedon queenslandica TaxID=400682 RepID=A0A1X7T9N6_AMPQE
MYIISIFSVYLVGGLVSPCYVAMQRPLSKAVYTLLTSSNSSVQSVGSVSSAGADSGVELLRRTTAYVIPKSTSNSTNISYDANSLGTYEVTLKKSPTLGLGITGGKDGENAIKPGDKVHSLITTNTLLLIE